VSSFSFRAATRTPLLSTLSLHDALPNYHGNSETAGDFTRTLQARSTALRQGRRCGRRPPMQPRLFPGDEQPGKSRGCIGGLLPQDRKSTRLNSSHVKISYAVFSMKTKT